VVTSKKDASSSSQALDPGLSLVNVVSTGERAAIVSPFAKASAWLALTIVLVGGRKISRILPIWRGNCYLPKKERLP
jgi:hypothetical protein